MEKERGIRCRATGMGWLYEWASNGMLKKVVRPDGRPVEFRYDALGRRTAKQYFGKVTRWVWDGNVPLHEWCYKAIGLQSDEEENTPPKEPAEDITTWLFEAGTFIPTAKIQEGKQYSIVSDYLGTPIQMYDGQGNKTWDCTLDIYGKVANFAGKSRCDCPFRFQGQYEDIETGLFYNRFRYYDSSIGSYISQDPIQLLGGIQMYLYVIDVNNWIDAFGLKGSYVFIIDAKNKIAYVGKGKWRRFRQSVRKRTKDVFKRVAKPAAWASAYYGDDDIAEMIEANVMEKMESLGYKLENKIKSPGANKLKKTSKAVKDFVEKAASNLIAEMFQNSGCDIKKNAKHH